MPGHLMPTSAERLRQIARERAEAVREAERALEHYQQRQEEAERTADLAEQGIAPPGFYLTD